MSQRGLRTLGENGPLNSSNNSHKNSQSLKQQDQGLDGSGTRFPAYVLELGTPDVRTSGSLFFWSAL